MTTPAPFDPKAFRDFEQAGWNAVAHKVNDHFGSLTRGFCTALLDAAGVQQGLCVLDLATGPGHVAAAAAQRGAKVIGFDFAPNMVAEARKLYPQVPFQVGDAEALPLPDEGFEAVVIGFGMMHFSRPDVVLAEVRRVLRPGGRLAFTVWGNPHESAVGMGILLRAVERHGTTDAGMPPGPPARRFMDHNETRTTLRAAGFVDPQVTDLPYTWTLPHVEAFFQAFYEAAVRGGAPLRVQPPDALAAIRTFVHNEVQAYAQGGVIQVPMGAVLASAVKPSA